MVTSWGKTCCLWASIVTLLCDPVAGLDLARGSLVEILDFMWPYLLDDAVEWIVVVIDMLGPVETGTDEMG